MKMFDGGKSAKRNEFPDEETRERMMMMLALEDLREVEKMRCDGSTRETTK